MPESESWLRPQAPLLSPILLYRLSQPRRTKGEKVVPSESNQHPQQSTHFIAASCLFSYFASQKSSTPYSICLTLFFLLSPLLFVCLSFYTSVYVNELCVSRNK